MIEFIKSSNNDTLFFISSYPFSLAYSIHNNQNYLGLLRTTYYNLYIFDQNKLTNKFFNANYLTKEVIQKSAMEPTRRVIIYGVYKKNVFYEITLKNISFEDQKLFQFNQ